jgi:hypothetical protein
LVPISYAFFGNVDFEINDNQFDVTTESGGYYYLRTLVNTSEIQWESGDTVTSSILWCKKRKPNKVSKLNVSVWLFL